MKKLFVFLFLLLLVGCGPPKGEIIIDINPGLDTIEINTEWEDEGVLLVQDDFRNTYYADEDPDTTTLGTKEVIYTINYEEETYVVTRYVTVTDQTAPIITLNIGIDTITLNGTWVDAGCVVTDNSNETLTCTTIDTVDTTTLGTYYITYEATDSSGNTATKTRVVTVIN